MMNLRYFALSLLLSGASSFAMVGKLAAKAQRPLVSTFVRNYRGIGNGCNNCLCERQSALILRIKSEAARCTDPNQQKTLTQRYKDHQDTLESRSRYFEPCLDRKEAAFAAASAYSEPALCS